MAGEKVPLVFFPRFSAMAGEHTFETTPIDVLGFETISVTYWRGGLVGSSAVFKLEESADLTTWTDLGSDQTPLTNTPVTSTETPSMRYVRCSLDLTGTDPSLTCWVVGYAQKTQM